MTLADENRCVWDWYENTNILTKSPGHFKTQCGKSTRDIWTVMCDGRPCWCGKQPKFGKEFEIHEETDNG